MRVLWFTNTPSLYTPPKKGYNGGGWISSLEEVITEQPDLELGVSFFHSDNCFKVKHGKTTYYPISHYNTFYKKLKHNLFYTNYDHREVEAYLEVIRDFNPDIIHIFGSEQSFGLITQYCKIPVVIQIQGMLSPSLNAWFAPGCNKWDYFRYYGLTAMFSKIKNLRNFTHNTKREKTILENCRNFIGRTEWDRNITGLYAPQARYFYSSEILRNLFYDAVPWQVSAEKKLSIVTTISAIDYKGFDLILKTAKLLKQYAGFNFEWRVFGITAFPFWERKIGIKAVEVNILLKGIAQPQVLIETMQNSFIFVHPSYIDNSPNSVCEAQLLGMPIIATNVGGVSTLIEHQITGLLVPANDPFILCCKIIELFNNKNLASTLGIKARDIALKRHDILSVIESNMIVYENLLNA